MFMGITGIDLLDQNVGMSCAKVRHRCSWISLVLIYLIKMLACHVPKLDSDFQRYITGIDLFDQNVGKACRQVRLQCSQISLVLIYLLKMWNGMCQN